MNCVKLFVVGNNGGQPDLVKFLPSSIECHEILHGVKEVTDHNLLNYC